MNLEDLAVLGIVGAVVGFGIEKASEHCKQKVRQAEIDKTRAHERLMLELKNSHEVRLAPYKRIWGKDGGAA